MKVGLKIFSLLNIRMSYQLPEIKTVEDLRNWTMEYYKDAVDFAQEFHKLPMPIDLREARRTAVKVAKEYGEANRENWDMSDSKIVYALENLAQGNTEALSNNKIIYSYASAPIQPDDDGDDGEQKKKEDFKNYVEEIVDGKTEEDFKKSDSGKEMESSL